MITFEVKHEFMQEFFPEITDKFLKNLRESDSKSNDTPIDKIQWVISWGFFVKKAKTEEEIIERDLNYQNKLKLKYPERLEIEVSRIRVDILMKAGNYIKGDRFNNTSEYITNMAKEVVKIMMINEQEYLQDPNVLDSMQDFMYLNSELSDDFQEQLDLDSILDKINKSGIQSLSKNELNYLEQASRK
jgi:hypothetical protein